jgi:hypothetical protein
MQAAVAPAATQLAEFRLAAEATDGTAVIYNVLSARRSTAGNVQTTIVFRGSGFGVEDTVLSWGPRGNDEIVEALYLPHENRVREMVPVMANTPFLRTDFTRADLGLVGYGEADYSVVGADQVVHQKAYKLQAVLQQPEYYSRIVTWVSATTYLPLRREFFDRAGRLWKIARYRSLIVDGHPTITEIILDDVQSRTSSELVMERLNYVSERYDSLFRTSALGKVAHHEAWNALRIESASAAVEHAGEPAVHTGS